MFALFTQSSAFRLLRSVKRIWISSFLHCSKCCSLWPCAKAGQQTLISTASRSVCKLLCLQPAASPGRCPRHRVNCARSTEQSHQSLHWRNLGGSSRSPAKGACLCHWAPCPAPLHKLLPAKLLSWSAGTAALTLDWHRTKTIPICWNKLMS